MFISKVSYSSVLADNNKKSNAACDISLLSPWKGSNAGLGFLMMTGDTKSNSLNANLNVSYNPKNKWSFSSKDQFQRSSSEPDGVTSWVLDLLGQANYNFTKTHFSFVSLEYINNKFDGYDYRLQEAAGYGKNISLPSSMKLSLQAGPGFEQNKSQDDNKRSSLVTANFTANYLWNFTKKSSLSEYLNTVASKQTILTTSTTSITANICNNVNLQVSYQLIHSSKPQPGKSKINTTTNISLLYDFV